MNKKEECEISRDLSVQYLEKSLNDGSTRFVETHLKNCDTCREYYKTIENNSDGKRKQDLPEVSSIELVSSDTNEYVIGEEAYDSFVISLNWNY